MILKQYNSLLFATILILFVTINHMYGNPFANIESQTKTFSTTAIGIFIGILVITLGWRVLAALNGGGSWYTVLMVVIGIVIIAAANGIAEYFKGWGQ